MSRLSALLARISANRLKTALIAVGIGLARGDMLPVILISGLFSVVQPGAKPVSQAAPRDAMVVPPARDGNC